MSALTFVLNDPPYENARTLIALRLVDAALRAGHDVNVFAYEGAVGLGFARQAPHANAVHGRDVLAEDHPITREWVTALVRHAADRRLKLDWVNCGLCVDERGVAEQVEGTRRGGPPDLAKFVTNSANTVVIPTRD